MAHFLSQDLGPSLQAGSLEDHSVHKAEVCCLLVLASVLHHLLVSSVVDWKLNEKNGVICSFVCFLSYLL